MNKLFLLISLAFLNTLLSAQVINVPQTFSSIQDAIDNANSGDTILVDTGIYLENIIISNKDIHLSSNYVFSGNPDDILNTIIDGSNPSHPDTASVVRIVDSCTRNMVLEGFTITGGSGVFFPITGATFIEGGGIAIQNSNATIRYNYIVDNHCNRSGGGVTSSGAGGIHTYRDTALIYGNVIEGNSALYGSGVVLNISSADFNNNLIFNNRGGQDFGAGGMMIFCDNTSGHCRVENNTIVSNVVWGTGNLWAGRSGGVFNIDCNDTELRNNIIWGNYQRTGEQVDIEGGNNLLFEYNVSSNLLSGMGNADQNPDFADSIFISNLGSYSIDFGDSAAAYNDIEDQNNPGSALFPSQGNLRNDCGVYGGPLARFFSFFNKPIYYQNRNRFIYNSISANDTIVSSFEIRNLGSLPLEIDSLSFSENLLNTINGSLNNNYTIGVTEFQTIEIEWLSDNDLADTLLIYHQDPNLSSPSKISFEIDVVSEIANFKDESINIFPNPFYDLLVLDELDGIDKVKIYNALGNLVYNKPANAARIEINTSNFKPGVYEIIITGNDDIKKSKLIKMRP